MSSALRLPPELQSFIELPEAQSLLVRGPPGSGKTTLGLALLESARGKKLLVSSRVRRDKVLRSFPWLGASLVESFEVVDADPGADTVRAAAQAHNHQHALLRHGAGGSTDLEQFLWLPPPLQEAWSRLPSSGPGLVVVDSWEALIEAYLGVPARPGEVLPDREEIERLLLRFMARTSSHLVLIVEHEEQTQLDYLVDGVAVTSRLEHDERLERWITFPKLRGVRIDASTYPFTLEDSRFTCTNALPADFRFVTTSFDADPDPARSTLWPGSRAFADSFGRLAPKSIGLLEADDNLPLDAVHMLTMPMVGSALQRGARALLVLPPSEDPADLWEALRGAVPPERMTEQLRIVSPLAQGGSTHREAPAGGPAGEGTARAETGPSEALEFIRGGDRPPNLMIAHLSGLQEMRRSSGGPLTSEQLSALLRTYVRDSPLHLMVVASANHPLKEAARSMALTYLRLRDRQGRPFLYGQRPRRPPFLVTGDGGITASGAPYDLLRIV